ncbi:MAG: selenocysteine-specific translation elongation factor [Pseudonocardia sp.]|jgi:selenocysteine-specific elongation factor|uniref:selenocysteine-specific translation elongation factor n=1 Tax=Pseudonocardia sp. TaxID=60912 RepID=UPI00261AC249|nr:selenocysteine-specific translation elongation factor [Pseudonocardia sp.]MCU1627636.1 selenocysteine-specific translation elongation factor [Pseudonocardia sp.]MDT7704024.1 selenocysteine-specific elongation factor [Pseudonocardiales bacterium]
MGTHVVATAGHVDHGKSTLVRALTGMEPDRFAEERRRGMTIDLGFAWTDLPSGDTVAFVDVPGHERFVTTMLAGVGPVPAVVLVVAADEGWMPQSAEHLDALEALGVRHALLVVTRSDLLDPELALAEAQERLAASALGIRPAVCVSAATGQGLGELRVALDLLVASLPEPDDAADVRMWIDRAFTIRGAGTVVTGTLAAGTLAAGDELVLDGGRTVSVRGLQSLGEPVERARGVARVAVNLRGVPLEAVARGDALLTAGAWLPTAELDVRLHGIRGAAPDPAALPRELTLHIGSAAVTARVRPLGGKDGDGADAVVARLRLRRPLPLRIGDRAVLRDPGRRQVAAGVTVLDPSPPVLRRRGAAARRADELAAFDGVPDAATELARRGQVRQAELVAWGVGVRDVERLDAVTAGGWLVDPARAPALVADLRAAVAAHDAADPLDPGLPLEAARRALGLPTARLVEALLRRVDGPGLVLRDGRVAADRVAALPERVRSALDALRADLERAPFGAPEAARLAELGLGPRELATLVRAGHLLRVADGVVLLPGADDRAVDLLRGLGPDFTLSSARQALGTSRRVAVPLLELLAGTGRTARTPSGGHRVV